MKGCGRDALVNIVDDERNLGGFDRVDHFEELAGFGDDFAAAAP